MDTTIYETILSLPVFKGVSFERISEVAGSSRLAFEKYTPGQVVIEAKDVCESMKFIIDGSVRVTITNSNGRFAVSQTLRAPSSMGARFLFGKKTIYPGSAVALENTSIMEMNKNDFVRLLHLDDVFLFNYLNELATYSQQGVHGVMSFTSGTLEERLAFWILSLTQRDGQDICLTCKQRDLYSVFGVQRSSFLHTMEEMTRRGYIDYEPGNVRVISRRKLKEILEL